MEARRSVWRLTSFWTPVDSAYLHLFDDDAVGPLDKTDKSCRISELRAPIAEIGFRDATRPAARPSSKNGNVLRREFFKRFHQRRPAHRKHSCGRGLAHQVISVSEQKDLHIVSRIAESQTMRKGKRSPRGVIGTPGAFHHDLQRFFRFFGFRRQWQKRQS